jgi:hypothetical protein
VQSKALAQLRAILPWIYAQVMETANRATDVAATQRLVQNFAKQSYELDAKHEMMGEAIDGLDDLDDLEDEMDGVMDSVLAEIGINLATQACPPLPRVTLRLSRDWHSDSLGANLSLSLAASRRAHRVCSPIAHGWARVPGRPAAAARVFTRIDVHTEGSVPLHRTIKSSHTSDSEAGSGGTYRRCPGLFFISELAVADSNSGKPHASDTYWQAPAT